VSPNATVTIRAGSPSSPSATAAAPPRSAGPILLPGHYRTRLRKGAPWLPVLIRVENSKDDEGRVADRPRLALYLGGERHERPAYEDWGHRLWRVSEAEYRRLVAALTPASASPDFQLSTAPSLF